MKTFLPFTYLIGWSKHQKFYYGVRYGTKVHPTDLWTTYFTSSKRVARFRQKYGEPDIIQIRKTFLTAEKAILWENKVLSRLKVLSSDLWINATTNKAISPHKCAEFMKGKTYEELYGPEKAQRLKKLRAESNRTRVVSDKSKQKQSQTMKGRSPWNKGIPRTEEEKLKMRLAQRPPRTQEAIEKAKAKIIGKHKYYDPHTGKGKMFFDEDAPLGWQQASSKRKKK